MKLTNFISIYSISVLFSLLKEYQCQGEEELSINFLPSEKYKLNKKDLINLRTDIERQLMQRIYEIQSNYEEREKLRLYSTNKPAIVPPYTNFQQPNYMYGGGGAGLNAQVNVGHSNHHSRSFLSDEDEKDEDVETENKIIEKKLTNLVKSKFAKEVKYKIEFKLETEIMLTKQAIGNIKKEIEETKHVESKPASITNVYHNVPNQFNPDKDIPRKIENEKLFEDKIELPKGDFPSFIQKNITKNTTLHEINITHLDKNNTLNLYKEVCLFVEGKSNLTKIQLEKKLIENGFKNTEDFINKYQNVSSKNIPIHKNVIIGNNSISLNSTKFKNSRFLQKARNIKIDDYKFSDKKYSNILSFFEKYNKIPSVLPNNMHLNENNSKNINLLNHLRIPKNDGPLSFTKFKEKTNNLLKNKVSASNGPVLIDLDNSDSN